MAKKTWRSMATAERKEVLTQFKGWDRKKLESAIWEKVPQTHNGKFKMVWTADFNTKLKLS